MSNLPKISRNRLHSTTSPELLAARDAVLHDIEGLRLTEAWQKFSIEWAHRMCAIAETSEGAARSVAWDVADRACREARDTQMNLISYFPKWFTPRIRRVIGPHQSMYNLDAPWVDHLNCTRAALPNGEPVQCFISEPYPWFAAPWMKDPQSVSSEESARSRWPDVVTGDYAHCVPADDCTASAVYVAKATGCQLVIDRVAWWSAKCIRLLFLPMNHRLSIKEAIKQYNPRPLYEVCPDACKGRECWR